MKNGFKTIRIGHSAVGHQRTTKRDDCATGGLYKTPAQGQSVDASEPVTVSWDTSCLDTDLIDLYLYSPSSAKPVLHEWENVNYKAGSYNATLRAGWWNYTSPINLEFTIVPSGQPLFMVTTPAGPLFSATYSSSDHSSSAVAGAVEQVNNTTTEKHGISKGAIAAAVIIPLLIVIALVSAAYIRINRQKGKEKRKRFSQMVDKRMSTISTDWKSITPAGANAAIRNSMAIPGNRASSFSFGGIRPMSTVAVEGGQAGIGARGVMDQDTPAADAPQMSQLRPGLRTSAFENRVSRVSFAADPRPSTESRRARQSRAFHTGYVPPLPERQYSTESSSNASPILSPIQTAGPLSLTAEDIRARMTGQEANARPSIDEVMPALSMMRNGEFEGGELLFQAPMPPSPAHQAHQAPTSPIMGAMPMQPMPANVMSPDDMLRAYAERRAMGATSPGAPALPTPAANYNGTGMRTLYSPDHAAAPVIPAFPEATYAAPANRKSLAPTEYGEDDAYVGTAE